MVNASPAERFGPADPESNFSSDGTITLVISADKVGGPKAGDVIGALVARSYPVAQDVTLRGDSGLQLREEYQGRHGGRVYRRCVQVADPFHLPQL